MSSRVLLHHVEVVTVLAINAFVGGLEFDAEDGQVASELMLERRFAKGVFATAEEQVRTARRWTRATLRGGLMDRSAVSVSC